MKTLVGRITRSKAGTTAVALVLAIGIGVLDRVTGRELALSAFYLLPVCLAAWVAGRATGIAMGVICTAVWFFSDRLGVPATTSLLIEIWNASTLLAFFVVVVWLLTAFRDSHHNLEQTVERRTAALRAEIEERKRLEHAKLQAERLAVVGTMAAQLAHEIRNPLGAILLNLDLVGEEVRVPVSSTAHSRDECNAYLREIQVQVQRIRQVLQEYLRFARMPKPERAAISLQKLFEEKLHFLQPMLHEKHIELKLNLESSLPPIHADPAELWEAMLNLIQNALDAMPDGGSLGVSTRNNGVAVLVSVSDTGRGLSEEELRNLFVPFFTTKSHGTGLGLAYAQQIITEHGGRIDCETVRGKGSTFTIQLPPAPGA